MKTPFTPYLITDDDSDTLAIVTGLYLADTGASELTNPCENIKYLSTYMLAQEILDLIEKGQ